mgnify:CR=1 FL=1
MREKNIVFESGRYFVYQAGSSYDVMRNVATHSEVESMYALSPDGLSLAVARCEYLSGREE